MSKTIHEAGLAVTLDGSILVNAVQFFRESKDPQELLRLALAEEGELFIGVAMTENETGLTLMRLDNDAAEAAAKVVGERQRRRRATARKRRKTAS
jgi:predicted RNA-binding protein YlxR (DUF448 family)